ncbi:MAG: S-layer homology domain-containing protein, partial [Candidatus Gracilibacteria bacterium]|nr:S-layer homology domain-containing protein [Candidatus Gracilibacteria bacterium]
MGAQEIQKGIDTSIKAIEALSGDKQKLEENDILELLKETSKKTREEFISNLKTAKEDVMNEKNLVTKQEKIKALGESLKVFKTIEDAYKLGVNSAIKTATDKETILKTNMDTLVKVVDDTQKELDKFNTTITNPVVTVEGSTKAPEKVIETSVITRGGFILKLFNNLKNIGKVSDNDLVNVPNKFSDDDGLAYEKVANFFASKGIISGTGDKTFDGNSSITKEQSIIILTRVLIKYGIITETNAQANKSDPNYYVEIAKNNGLIDNKTINNTVNQAVVITPENQKQNLTETESVALNLATENQLRKKEFIDFILKDYKFSSISSTDLQNILSSGNNFFDLLTILDINIEDFKNKTTEKTVKDSFYNKLSTFYASGINIDELLAVGKDSVVTLFQTLNLTGDDRFSKIKFHEAYSNAVNHVEKVDNKDKYVYVPILILAQGTTKVDEFVAKQVGEKDYYDVKLNVLEGASILSGIGAKAYKDQKSEIEFNTKETKDIAKYGIKVIERNGKNVLFIPKNIVKEISANNSVEVESDDNGFYISGDKKVLKDLTIVDILDGVKNTVLFVGGITYDGTNAKILKDYKTTIITSLDKKEFLGEIIPEVSKGTLNFGEKFKEATNLSKEILDSIELFDKGLIRSNSFAKKDKEEINQLIQNKDIDGAWNVFTKTINDLLYSANNGDSNLKAYQTSLSAVNEYITSNSSSTIEQKKVILDSYIQSTSRENRLEKFNNRHPYFDQMMAKLLGVDKSDFTNFIEPTRDNYINGNEYLSNALNGKFSVSDWNDDENFSYSSSDLFGVNCSLGNTLAP